MKHTAPSAKAVSSPLSSFVVDSPTLARLIEEVRQERDQISIARNYDRTHNRHNR
jgi:hypothetical protein